MPAGNSDGGQWTSGGGSAQNDAAQSFGNIDPGNLPSFSDLFALFQISPQEFDATDDIQFAGDPPGIGHNGGPSLDPPEIPESIPDTTRERMGFVRAAAAWIGAVGRYTPFVGAYFEALDPTIRRSRWGNYKQMPSYPRNQATILITLMSRVL